MVNEYILGQRWLSNAEVELGLGMVVETNERSVTLQFPACAETRIYARRTAPLTRIRLNVGEPAEDQEGRSLTVVAVEEQSGLLVYRVVGEDGKEHALPEPGLHDRLRVNRPQDKLLTGRIDRDVWFELRHQAWRQMADSAQSPVFGLTGPRVSLIPHQLYIASEVAKRLQPRVLLADEVGLGKTIEAGLILHKLLLAGRVQRVLIIVPESLQHQWLVEMLRRFNLSFALFDQERIDAIDDGNPFQTEQRVLCSLNLLTGSPAIARAALAGDWDLLIVDEAHHLSWSEQESSLDYDLIAALAAETRGLLLLSATPEQFGRAGHFARLRLLDPDRFHDYQSFVDEERQYEPVARIAGRLLDGDELSDSDQTLLADWLGEDPADLSTEAIIERLVDRHGTGRVMFRNTRAVVRGFPEREVLPTALEQPEAATPEPTPEPDSDQAPKPTTTTPDWTSTDPRIPWLLATLNELSPDKVLLITAGAQTVLNLRDALQAREGIPAAVFHEGMSIVERDRAAAWFAARDNGAQVLLCSEIGSEGRNFQFAHHLILFDLPPSPDLLEQRIGRLDRIGQRETIQIHVPYLQGSDGDILFHWYHEGLDALAQASPAAAAVQQTLSDELAQVLNGEDELPALIEQAQVLRERLGSELEAGRDRLLELQAHHPEQAAELIEAIRWGNDGPSPLTYMTRFWDAFGIDHELGPGRSTILHPTNHMLHAQFPCLPEDGLTVTFSRSDALSHEDREFLTTEHPMVRGAMEMLTSDELGAAALTLIRHPRVRPGSVLLELFYIIECAAPGALEIGRFLPATPIRLLLDEQGRDRSSELDAQALTGECLTRKKKLAHQVIEALTPKLRPLFTTADELAEQAAKPLVVKAISRMQQTLDAEYQRLEQLRLRNPNVRQQELDDLREQRAGLEERLGDSRMRLDAARLIVAQ